MEKPHIYKITNLINGKVYIGAHNGSNKYYFGSGILLEKAIKKYGKENFRKDILETFNTAKEAYAREREIVNQEIVDNPQFYNLTLGGRGFASGKDNPMYGIGTFNGKSHSEDFKKKQSENISSRIWIHKFSDGVKQNARIKSDELEHYLSKGWIKGRGPRSKSVW